MSPSDIITNYPLTENFLSKMEHAQKEIRELPLGLTTLTIENDRSISSLITFVSNHTKLKHILEKNGLTPKDYVFGFMALQATLDAISSLDDKDALLDEAIPVPRRNLKFGKKYINRIRSILDN